MRLMRGTVVAIALVVLLPSTQQAQAPAAEKLLDAPLTHVGIVVSDVEQAAKKYAQLLGVPVPPIHSLTDVKFPRDYRGDRKAYPKVATFALNNVTVELLQPQGGASPWRERLEKSGPGLDHIAFGVARSAGHLRHLQDAGGALRVGGAAGGPVTSLDFTRQLGFNIELQETTGPAPPAPTYPAGSFGNNPVVHVSAVVPDVEKAGGLVADILGTELPSTTVVKMGSLVYPGASKADPRAAPKHVTFKLPNILLELTEPQGGSSPWRDQLDQHGQALHHMAFRVGNMADAIAYLEHQAGRLVLGGPGVAYAYVDLRPEPLGFTFELNGPRP